MATVVDVTMVVTIWTDDWETGATGVEVVIADSVDVVQVVSVLVPVIITPEVIVVVVVPVSKVVLKGETSLE